jgi:hypothetical protein
MRKRAIFTTILASTIVASASIFAIPADFELKATFKRNPKIWGTYKLDQEKVVIKRGKRKWRKTPPNRIGDVIISNGNLVFLRETQNNAQTTIVVDKIPYKKIGSNTYSGALNSKNHREIVARLFEEDLKDMIPHRDLLEGEIDYQSINCYKKRGRLTCHVKGKLNP